MNCDEINELLPAYVVDALEEDERAAVESHLETCALHGDVNELREAAFALSEAAGEREPPAELRGRIMSRVAASERTRTVSPVEPDRMRGGDRAGRWRGGVAGYAIAAVLAVVAIGLATWNIVLQSGEQDSGVVTQAFAPEHGGRFVYLPDEALAVVTFERLQPLPTGRIYQAWTIRKGEAPRSAGLLAPSQGDEAALAIPMRLMPGDIVALTIEPAGGSTQPTSDPIAAVGP